MTAFDEELSALLALDALEPDEQADAELRLGTFGAGLRETCAALAEGAATPVPTNLRAATLATALDRRRPGRPVKLVAACDPAVAFDRTIADLFELLCALTEAEFDLPAHSEHGRVRDLVAHLYGVEQLALQWLDPAAEPPAVPDHVAATRPVIAQLGGDEPRAVARRWHDSARAVASAAAAADPARPVSFHDMTTSVTGFLTIRTFELWAHSMDISAATGRGLPRLDPERMTALSGRLMSAVPMALAYRHGNAAGRTARFVLTGAAGGCYTVPLHPGDAPGEPDVTIVADVVDVCRVAARRLRPAELNATVEGDRALADLVLASLDAFARD